MLKTKVRRKSKNGKDSGKLSAGQVSSRLPVPDRIVKPSYVDQGQMPWGEQPEIHDAEVAVSQTLNCSCMSSTLILAGPPFSNAVTK